MLDGTSDPSVFQGVRQAQCLKQRPRLGEDTYASTRAMSSNDKQPTVRDGYNTNRRPSRSAGRSQPRNSYISHVSDQTETSDPPHPRPHQIHNTTKATEVKRDSCSQYTCRRPAFWASAIPSIASRSAAISGPGSDTVLRPSQSSRCGSPALPGPGAA